MPCGHTKWFLRTEVALLVTLSAHFYFNQCVNLQVVGDPAPGQTLGSAPPQSHRCGVSEFKERAVRFWGMTPPCGLASSLPGGMGWQPAKHHND